MQIFTNIQQWTPEWLKMRAWVFTWTLLKRIMSGKFNKDGDPDATMLKAMKTVMYELIGGEFSYDENAPEVKNYLMNAWNELEPIARAKYQELTWLKVIEVWFVKKNDWLWISPDWLIITDEIDLWNPEESSLCPIYGKAVEFKCPLGNDSAKFFKYMFEWINALKNDTDKYIWQIVHYFININELQELDFVVYNPNIAKEKQMHIITIKREDIQDLIEQAEERIKIFREIWVEHIKLLIK